MAQNGSTQIANHLVQLMVFDIPTGSSSGVEMDYGFGPNVDSDAISARIKEEGLVQTWTGMRISVVDGFRHSYWIVQWCRNGLWLMVFDIPTGSSSGVEIDNGFGPNVDTDAILARIKEEGLVQTWTGMRISLMVFDIPTGSSSGVEMDNGFGPNIDTDAILARIKEEGLVQTWIGMRISLMGFDIPTGSSSGVEVEYILTDKTETLTGKKMIFRRCCINGVFYGNETGDALKGIESFSFPVPSTAALDGETDVKTRGIASTCMGIPSDLLYKIKVGVLFLFQSQSTNRMKRFVYVNDDESSASQDLYCDNHISNRKYSVLNFIPKNLWEQFSRFMNQYFLLIACLQLWSLITPVNPVSTWACKYMGSFIFIFAVSASKEAWGDCNRYLSDKKQTRNKSGLLDKVEAQDIHVRNIVWLRENDEVPCDLVLIGTSDPLGLCYIETAALDGETDLKTRSIPSTCMGIPFDLLYKIKGVIECPKPDKDIRRFDANLRLFPPFIDNDVCPLTIKNTLLQSCYLRNTEWACGVAIYTEEEEEEEEESFDGSKRVDPDRQSSCPVCDAISARIKEEDLVQTWIGMQISLMVFDIPTGSSSGVEMDNGFGPNVDTDANLARIKEEGLVQTWTGMRISLMVFDIPTGSSSGVEMDNGFGPNIDTDAILARIKEEGLVQTWIGMRISLMVFDIPTGSSSGVEMDNGFGPNIDTDAILARIKEEGLVQTWIGMRISLMVFDIPTGSSSGVEMDNGFGPNIDTDAILARIKEEGLLMVLDIPTGSSSGVEMDNGFGPNVDSDAISARIKEEGLVQTWRGMRISVVDGV
ncbi:hypothetical protein ACFE04_016800 [Oxalis oulophora]